MTAITSTAPVSPADRQQAQENALAEARQYLAATADKVYPGLSARSLLRYVTEYRAHLATLVAACSELATGTSDD